MAETSLVHTIRNFIIESFLPGERPENLPANLNLIQAGILDSLALVETASFLEELAGCELEGYELTPDNVGSIAAMAAFVQRCRGMS
jgi:acyl carrier protein